MERGFLITALVSLGSATHMVGCGASVPDGFPAPGEVQVVSVEPVELAPRANLIPNGTFRMWWAGAPVAEGFLPPDARFSRLERATSPRGHIARQVWRRPDAGTNPEGRLRVFVPDLEPNQPYLLTVTAISQTPCSVSIGVFAATEAAIAAELVDAGIALLPTANLVKAYRSGFVAPQTGSVMITAQAFSFVGDEAVVDWFEWRLEETPSPGA